MDTSCTCCLSRLRVGKACDPGVSIGCLVARSKVDPHCPHKLWLHPAEPHGQPKPQHRGRVDAGSNCQCHVLLVHVCGIFCVGTTPSVLPCTSTLSLVNYLDCYNAQVFHNVGLLFCCSSSLDDMYNCQQKQASIAHHFSGSSRHAHTQTTLIRLVGCGCKHPDSHFHSALRVYKPLNLHIGNVYKPIDLHIG